MTSARGVTAEEFTAAQEGIANGQVSADIEGADPFGDYDDEIDNRE